MSASLFLPWVVMYTDSLSKILQLMVYLFALGVAIIPANFFSLVIMIFVAILWRLNIHRNKGRRLGWFVFGVAIWAPIMS